MASSPQEQWFEECRKSILIAIADLFVEPRLERDDWLLKLLDQDDNCIWLGLYSVDGEGNASVEAVATWTIEVSREETHS